MAGSATVHARPGEAPWATVVDDVELTVYHRCGEPHVMLFEVPGLRGPTGSLRLPDAWVDAAHVTLPAGACK